MAMERVTKRILMVGLRVVEVWVFGVWWSGYGEVGIGCGGWKLFVFDEVELVVV